MTLAVVTMVIACGDMKQNAQNDQADQQIRKTMAV